MLESHVMVNGSPDFITASIKNDVYVIIRLSNYCKVSVLYGKLLVSL